MALASDCHVYLSPHFDDAIFSCGGSIHRQRSAGQRVDVITLCAGYPDSEQLSAFAKTYHNAWGNPGDVVGTRRAEDEAVLKQWSVAPHYVNTPDSLYRRSEDGFAYTNLAALFSSPPPGEREVMLASWQQHVIGVLNDCTCSHRPQEHVTLYAPLAAGNHVDHQLVRMLGVQLAGLGWRVLFYEDYPHAEMPGSIQMALQTFQPLAPRSCTVPIDVNARMLAMSGYRSQIPSIFGDQTRMTMRVKLFTAECACDINLLERSRRLFAGSGGRRERMWRAMLGFHAHAERFWRMN